MNFSFLPLFAVLFFTCISCSNSDQTSELELKKLEIEKKKLELEEKKLDHEMEQLSSTEQPKEKHSLAFVEETVG